MLEMSCFSQTVHNHLAQLLDYRCSFEMYALQLKLIQNEDDFMFLIIENIFSPYTF